MSGLAYLGVPAINVPLPDSPLSSRVPSPSPITPDVDPTQPTLRFRPNAYARIHDSESGAVPGAINLSHDYAS